MSQLNDKNTPVVVSVKSGMVPQGEGSSQVKGAEAKVQASDAVVSVAASDKRKAEQASLSDASASVKGGAVAGKADVKDEKKADSAASEKAEGKSAGQERKPGKPRKAAAIASDAIEYLPDAQEIEQQHLPWFARVGILWIGLIMGSVLAWACLSKVDVIVRAPGRIVSEKGNIVMKPRESAVIQEIHVHQGDIVDEGQVLLTFDPTLNQAEVDRLEREIRVLEAEFERLRCEFEGQDYLPRNPKEENCAWQLAIFKQRHQYYQEKLNYYDSNLSRLIVAHKSTKESFDKYLEILESTGKIEKMYVDLHQKNVVAYKETLEVMMSRMEVEVEADRLRNQLVEYEQQQQSTKAEKNAFVEEWRNGISEKLVSAGRELDGNKRQLEKYKSLVSYVTLCAPCKAVVHEMASFPVGSAVGEAEAVITLVPLDGRREIEAEIRPQDIRHVHRFSEARIKLTAFPYQKFGTLDGRVRIVSANTLNRSEAGQNISYYRANIMVTGRDRLRNIDEKFMLIPGMETEVELKAGKRRIIEYLVYPLIKGLDNAFKEP